MAIDLGAVEARLNTAFAGAVVEREGNWLVLDRERLLEIATYLRDQMGFDFLTHLSASDYPDHMDVVYNLYSTRPELQGPACRA
jgi:NADH:ubiquinone oxidoreductase subunit C